MQDRETRRVMTEKQQQFHHIINFMTGVSVVLVLSMLVAFGKARPGCEESVGRPKAASPVVQQPQVRASHLFLQSDRSDGMAEQEVRQRGCLTGQTRTRCGTDYAGARQIYCQYAFVCDDSLDHPLARPQLLDRNWTLS
jgi:hypothetical protein